MATVTETHRSGGLGCVGVLILLILGAVLLGQAGAVLELEVPGVGSVETGDHAIEQHGDEAELVRSELAAGGAKHHRCRDGKEYLTKRLDDGQYALMIVRDGREVTAYTATLDYVRRHLQNDGCGGWAHP